MDDKPEQTIRDLSAHIETLQTTLDHVGAYVFSKDLHGKYTFANQKVRDLFGRPLAEIIGSDDSKFFSLEQSNNLRKNDEIVMLQGKTINEEERNIIIKTGQPRYYLTEKKPLLNAKKAITGMIVVSTDITAIKQAQLLGATQTEIMSHIVNRAPLKTILTSLVESIEEQSPSSKCSILLIDDIGKHLLSGAAPSLPDAYNQAIEGMAIGYGAGCCGTAAFTKKRVIVEDILTHPYWADFKELAVEAQLGSCWSEPILSKEGKALGTFAIYHKTIASPDEHDFKLIELASQLATIAIEQEFSLKQQQLFHQIYNHSHEGILILDSQGIILQVNSTFRDITGFSQNEVQGKKIDMLYPKATDPKTWPKVHANQYWQDEIWNTNKEGKAYNGLLTISTILDGQGMLLHYVCMLTDITLRKKHQQQLEKMAHYDQLTQLPNRALFVDRFNQAVANNKRSQKQLAIYFIDLDNFKPVNDSFGHPTGDLLLVEVAKRIKIILREQDTVCRQGGDEFAVLLANIKSVEQYEEIIKRIHHSIAQPFLIEGNSHSVTASTGIALYPRDGNDIDTLLRHADQAMYEAKLSGKQRYEFFNLSQNERSVSKRQSLDEIEHALINNELTLFYQPEVNMATGEVYGAEALIRWMHPEKGQLLPIDFLPITIGTKLEVKIGSWIINQALIQMELWRQNGHALQISVNIASRHLLSDSFISKLTEALAKCPRLDSKFLELEILESSALQDLSAVSRVIDNCQEKLGISFALDDFGTGYSSLAHLRNLSANTIKIDRTFVHDMLCNPNDFAIIESVISLGKAFHKSIIAEGVESAEHGLMLLLLGCENAQGFGIARPMPPKQLSSWLKQYSPNKQWIRFARKHHKAKEQKTEIFKLITASWFKHFTSNLKSPPREHQSLAHRQC